jgi:hypothetical protein
VFSGKSVLSAGEATGKKETIGKLLSPLTKEEVGSIRCIGLNVSIVSLGVSQRKWHRNKLLAFDFVVIVLTCLHIMVPKAGI